MMRDLDRDKSPATVGHRVSSAGSEDSFGSTPSADASDPLSMDDPYDVVDDAASNVDMAANGITVHDSECAVGVNIVNTPQTALTARELAQCEREAPAANTVVAWVRSADSFGSTPMDAALELHEARNATDTKEWTLDNGVPEDLAEFEVHFLARNATDTLLPPREPPEFGLDALPMSADSFSSTPSADASDQPPMDDPYDVVDDAAPNFDMAANGITVHVHMSLSEVVRAVQSFGRHSDSWICEACKFAPGHTGQNLGRILNGTCRDPHGRLTALLRALPLHEVVTLLHRLGHTKTRIVHEGGYSPHNVARDFARMQDPLYRDVRGRKRMLVVACA